MLIGVIGDVHGNQTWLRSAVSALRERQITTVFQVGDLGVSGDPRDEQAWHLANKYLKLRGMTMYVAPGNHEDYDAIEALPAHDDGWLRFRSQILLAPRGHRSVVDGRSVVWLGGAGSVDRKRRQAGEKRPGSRRLWWPQEALTDADVAATAAGGRADIMVSHDAPSPLPSLDRRLRRQFDAEDVAYAHASRELFTSAVAAVRPAVLLHGHYHVGVTDTWVDPTTGEATRILGLSTDMDTRAGVAILDTEMLAATHLEIAAP